MATALLLLALQAPIISLGAHLTTPVAGLANTGATESAVDGKGFKARRVVVARTSAETNATQLTLPNAGPVGAGEVLVATVWLRGARPGGKPAHVELLFERATSPWTKSLTQGVDLSNGWRAVALPFRAAEGYAPGEAMLSIRLAFGPQTVEVGPASVARLGPNATLDEAREAAAARDPLGLATVTLDLKRPRQTMVGFGGDFPVPRYGGTESPDAVGRYALANLNVVHARVGLPLDRWNPEPGIYRDDAQAAASLRCLGEMARRRIPTVLSIWEGPAWMLPGPREGTGRVLDPSKYGACVEAIVRYLVLARDKYGAKVDLVSFNEPDYGVNFRFTPDTMRAFVAQAGPALRAAGLATRFVVGDTANGAATVAFCTPLLEDKALAPYLGPIGFHSWDALSASEETYAAIAALGKRHKKPVWCLEAGHDAQLWQQKDPWRTWDNALRTAMAYERTLRLSGTPLMDYWTYEDNYPLSDGKRPFPVFAVMRQMGSVFRKGARVVFAPSSAGGLQALGAVGPKGAAVLLVNPRGAGRATVRGFRPLASVRIVTSDRTAQGRATVVRADAKGAATVVLPARSVVTATSP